MAAASPAPPASAAATADVCQNVTVPKQPHHHQQPARHTSGSLPTDRARASSMLLSCCMPAHTRVRRGRVGNMLAPAGLLARCTAAARPHAASARTAAPRLLLRHKRARRHPGRRLQRRVLQAAGRAAARRERCAVLETQQLRRCLLQRARRRQLLQLASWAGQQARHRWHAQQRRRRRRRHGAVLLLYRPARRVNGAFIVLLAKFESSDSDTKSHHRPNSPAARPTAPPHH